MVLNTEHMKIVGAVANYWIISIALVFVNKTILSGETKIDAPLCITWYQCLVTVLACYILGGRVKDIPKAELDIGILKQILPLSFVFSGMIVFNNLCLKYVEVSFYQVARSLTMPFNVILGYIVLKQSTSLNSLLCCAIVLFGFFLGNYSEVNWDFKGVMFGLCSSVFVAMNSVLVKKYLAIVDNNSWKITLYNNVNASVIFLPLIVLSGEIQVVMNSPNIYKPSFWLMNTIAAFLGVAIGIAVATQIKYTSPLTHNVSGTAKAAAQTALSLVYFGNEITWPGIFSVLLVLGGSLAYALVRKAEMEAAKATQENKNSAL